MNIRIYQQLFLHYVCIIKLCLVFTSAISRDKGECKFPCQCLEFLSVHLLCWFGNDLWPVTKSPVVIPKFSVLTDPTHPGVTLRMKVLVKHKEVIYFFALLFL